MADLHAALKQKGMVVELKTCHRSEGNLIFDNATRISQQREPVFDKSGGFRLVVPTRHDLNKIPGSVRPGAVNLKPATLKPINTTKKFKGGGADMSQERREMYWSLLSCHRDEFNIEDDQTSQIISFINRDCDTLNQFGCYVYNKHLVYDLEQSRRYVKQFHIRDKVMCTKNADISVYEPEEGAVEGAGENPIVEQSNDGLYTEPDIELREKQERLMNGSLFKIRAVVKRQVKKEIKEAEDNPTTDSTTNQGDGGTEGPKHSTHGLDGATEETKLTEYYVLDDLTGEIVRANKELIRNVNSAMPGPSPFTSFKEVRLILLCTHFLVVNTKLGSTCTRRSRAARRMSSS